MVIASGSSSSLHAAAAAAADSDFSPAQPSTPSAKTLAPPANPAVAAGNARSAFSPLRVAASPIALLGSVRKMVTKPLSWLTGTAAAAAASTVEQDLGIPTSSSTNSLSSIARRRAAAQASLPPRSDQSNYERDAPTRAARAVGERLAAGLRSRSNLHDDEESQLHPPASTLPASASMSHLAPPPARKRSSLAPLSPQAGPSSLPTSDAPTDADRPSSWNTRSSKRTLDVTPRSGDANRSVEVLSDAGRASPAPALHSRSYTTLRSPRSQLLALRGSSLRPDDAMSESGSTSLSHSNSFSAFGTAFGYGNEVRYADSGFGLPPSSSPFQLSSRNSLYRPSRSNLRSGLFSDAGTPARTSRAGSVGLRSASPALSATNSPATRRNWNAINLAAPSNPSLGDELMREYLSTRTLPGVNPTVRRSLGLPADDPMATSSVAGGSVMDESESLTPSRLGKRDIDMSVDGDSAAMGTPSKRRMVWHPELGFISHEELKAREPKPPSPKNEAERLLNVLETLRKPTATARGLGVGLSRGPPTSINVPAPISDAPASAARSAKSHEAKPTVGVAPYTRYLRKAKAIQSNADDQGGMRARLKKTRTNAAADEAQMETDPTDTDGSVVSDNEEMHSEHAEDEPEQPVSPPPEPIRRSRRLQKQTPMADAAVQTPIKADDKGAARTTQLKSALKATPLRAAQPAAPVETPKPASHRIALSAANKAPATAVKKDNFAVRTTNDASAPREKSSLRQGAAKTSRTHQSSGKFSAWDEDDEDDGLPDATELAKIKLPTNMFPSGFSFGGKPLDSGEAAKPAAGAGSSEAPKTTPAPAPAPAPAAAAGGSLLGRLGGFDSASSENKDAPKPTTSALSFSFPPSAKQTPAEPPKFSFGAVASAGKDDSTQKKPSAAPPASDFFSKPAEPSSASLTDGKKDGPVPNFFGSTMKKFEPKADGAPAAKPAPAAGGFSFSAPAAAAKDDAAKPAPFSFGAKPASEPKPAETPSPFGGFGAKPTQPAQPAQPVGEKAESAAPASKPSFFGSTSTSSGGFSFGTPSTSASTGAKRAADDDEPAAKKSMPSFAFGAPTASKPEPAASAAPASSGFSFGSPALAAAPAAKKDEAPPSSVPNFFGGKGDSAGETAKPAPAATSFSFGKPAGGAESAPASASNSAPGSGTSTPTFSFGGAASGDGAKPAGGFSFGAASGAGSASAPAAGGFGAGGFSFGPPKSATPAPAAAAAAAPVTTQGAGEMMDDSPQKTSGAPTFAFGSATPASTPAKPAGGFTFGSPAPASTAPATSAASTSFTFGAPAAGSVGGGTSTPASAAPATSSAATTGFTFGAPAAAAGGSAGTFRFGSPAPSPAPGGFTFGGGSTTPAVGSAPASPFLAPAAAPTTPGGSPFQFGAPAAPTGGSAPFQFGSPAPAAPAAAPAGQFGFGSSTPTPTPATGQGFGTAGGFGTPSTPSGGGGFTFASPAQGMAALPQMPQTAQPGLFSMGAPPAASPAAPGARQIKPLRQRRR